MIISIDDIIKILKSKWYIGIILSILIFLIFHFFIIPQEIGKKENTIQTLLASPIYSELAYFQFKKEIDIIKEKYKTNLIRVQDYIQSYSPFKIILFSEWSNKTPNNLIIEFKKDLFASFVKSMMLNKDLELAVNNFKKYNEILNKINEFEKLNNNIKNKYFIETNNLIACYFSMFDSVNNKFEISETPLYRNTTKFITNFEVVSSLSNDKLEPRIYYKGFGNLLISNVVISEVNNKLKINLNLNDIKHETGTNIHLFKLAKEINNKAGHLLFNNKINLPEGKYKIEISYSSEKPNYNNWNNYINSNLNALIKEKEKYRFIENYITNILENKFDYEKYKNLVYITDIKRYYYETVSFFQRIIIIGLFSLLTGFTVLIFSIYWLKRG